MNGSSVDFRAEPIFDFIITDTFKDNLVRRSRLFETLFRYSGMSVDIGISQHQTHGNIPTLSIYVPLYTELKGNNLTKVAGNSNAISYIGTCEQTEGLRTISRRMRRKYPLIAAVNLFHFSLCVTIISSCEFVDDHVPEADLLRDHLTSVFHIADIIGSEFLLEYAARWFTNPDNVFLYLQYLSTKMDKSGPRFLGLFHKSMHALPMPPDVVIQYISTHKHFARELRRQSTISRLQMVSFWREQSVWRKCVLCGLHLSNLDKVHGFPADIQILPCCWSLCHLECINKLLLFSMACDHRCRHPVECLRTRNPYLVTGNNARCNSCDKLYYRGFLDDDFDDFHLIMKRTSLKASYSYNGDRLARYPEMYIYPMYVQAFRVLQENNYTLLK